MVAVLGLIKNTKFMGEKTVSLMKLHPTTTIKCIPLPVQTVLCMSTCTLGSNSKALFRRITTPYADLYIIAIRKYFVYMMCRSLQNGLMALKHVTDCKNIRA